MQLNLRMFRVLVLLVATGVARGPTLAADAPSPVGRWRTYDSETKELRSIVEITVVGDALEGKVVERFPPQDDPTQGICSACEGERKGKPVLGMTILWGVKPDGSDWSGGNILQPRTGRAYSVKLHLEDRGQKLEVRGYIGSPLFGETQIWTRAD